MQARESNLEVSWSDKRDHIAVGTRGRLSNERGQMIVTNSLKKRLRGTDRAYIYEHDQSRPTEGRRRSQYPSFILHLFSVRHKHLWNPEDRRGDRARNKVGKQLVSFIGDIASHVKDQGIR